MRTQKFAPFCALILTLGFLLLTAGKAHAQVSILAQVCGFMNGKTTGLTPASLATLKTTVLPKNALTEDHCLAARPLFKVGGITAFYQDKEGRYIFMLQHGQDISSVVISETGVPEVQFNQTEVTMADGIKLPTFIVRSKKTANNPGFTILTRSPYMNSKLWWVADAVTLARQGYQVVQQPARGTFTAPGELEWMNWRQERSDAQSTLDWISTQPWSNRQIAVKGNSYDGFLALAASTTFHPNLVAVIASGTPWNAKVDSVSGRADVLDVAAYVATLNGSGSSYAPAHKLMGALADKVPSIPGFIKAIQASFKLKFNGIPLDGKFPDNRDFAAEIKKSKATMLYSYGLYEDQDSRDILNLAKIIQGTPHHYFMGQSLGHDIGMALMLFRKVKVAGARSAQDFSDGIKKEFGGYSSCAYVDPEGTEKFCANDVSKIFPSKPLQLPLQNLSLKGQQGVTWDLDKEGLIVGQAKLRFKVTVPALPKRMRLMYAPFYCTKEKCQNITEGAPGGEPLSEGVQVIEFETNHIMQSYEAGAKIGIVFRAIDAKSEVISIPIELNHIQFILPVQE
jgi:dienelactone hydrolase